MVKKSRRCKSKTYRARHTRKRQRFGGGLKTAVIYFHSNIKEKYPNIVDDAFFLRKGFVFPTMAEVQTYDEKVKNELQQIIDTIIGKTNKDLIDFVMQLYLNGKMGEPNSFENIGRLIENATKFIVLKQKGMNDGKQLLLEHFPSLSALEEFIEAKKDMLEQIEEEKTKKSKKAEVQRRLREEGEDDVEVKFENSNYIVYMPTTVAGSRFYGRNTRWCTAASGHNMFDEYTREWNMHLYIIQNKKDQMDKTQFHPVYMQFMNPRDRPVQANEIEILFQDKDLKNWFRQTAMMDKFVWIDAPQIVSWINPGESGPSLPGKGYRKVDDLFYLKYRYIYRHEINIDLFNALFGLREMPQEMVENIKKLLLRNVKPDDDKGFELFTAPDDLSFLSIVRLLSEDELDYIFEDASFREKFMRLESVSENTPWFFWNRFRKYYPDYFDNEEIMLQTLTTHGRPEAHFVIISLRLKRDLNFFKKLLSAEYGPHDDATKYCRHIRDATGIARSMGTNTKEISELMKLCNENREKQIKDGKHTKFHPGASGNLYIGPGI